MEVQKFILSCVCCEISNKSAAVLFPIMTWDPEKTVNFLSQGRRLQKHSVIGLKANKTF